MESFEAQGEAAERATMHGYLYPPGGGGTGAVGVDSCDTEICGKTNCGYWNTCYASCGSDPCACDNIEP